MCVLQGVECVQGLESISEQDTTSQADNISWKSSQGITCEGWTMWNQQKKAAKSSCAWGNCSQPRVIEFMFIYPTSLESIWKRWIFLNIINIFAILFEARSGHSSEIHDLHQALAVDHGWPMNSSKCSFQNLSQICSVNLCNVVGMFFYQLKDPKRSTSLISPGNFSHDPRVSPYVSRDVRYVFTSLGAYVPCFHDAPKEITKQRRLRLLAVTLLVLGELVLKGVVTGLDMCMSCFFYLYIYIYILIHI